MSDNLEKLIQEYQELAKDSTDTPWYIGDVYIGDYECQFCPIGPYDMSDKQDKHPYEDTIAEFWGAEHSCHNNAKLTVMAVNLVPLLIDRITEMENQQIEDSLSDNHHLIATYLEHIANRIRDMNIFAPRDDFRDNETDRGGADD